MGVLTAEVLRVPTVFALSAQERLKRGNKQGNLVEAIRRVSLIESVTIAMS